MGCFGDSGAPSYTPPNIQLPTATDLYNQANTFWQNTNPTLYNAQSNAIKNSTDPNYYNSFQPSSFQQALGSQYFQNVWPDTQAYMKDQLSKSGFINSPGASQALGNSLGNIETGIGQYLSGIGQQQANTGIQAGLSAPLSGMLNPFVQTGQQQSDQQANLTLANSQSQYQNALNQYVYGQQQQQGIGGGLGGILGGVGGFMLGGPAVAGLGAGLGSQLGTGIAGGTMNPYALALSGMSTFGGGTGVGQGQSYGGYSLNPFGNYSNTSPMSQYNGSTVQRV